MTQSQNQSQTQSDLQKAVDNVNPSDLVANLNPNNKSAETPENLDKNQATPFIDDSVRTDK